MCICVCLRPLANSCPQQSKGETGSAVSVVHVYMSKVCFYVGTSIPAVVSIELGLEEPQGC